MAETGRRKRLRYTGRRKRLRYTGRRKRLRYRGKGRRNRVLARGVLARGPHLRTRRVTKDHANSIGFRSGE